MLCTVCGARATLAVQVDRAPSADPLCESCLASFADGPLATPPYEVEPLGLEVGGVRVEVGRHYRMSLADGRQVSGELRSTYGNQLHLTGLVEWFLTPTEITAVENLTP